MDLHNSRWHVPLCVAGRHGNSGKFLYYSVLTVLTYMKTAITRTVFFLFIDDFNCVLFKGRVVGWGGAL